VFVVIVDSRFYFFFAWIVYGILMLLLVSVLIFGKEINGARSWFEFGPFSLQPSEFAKFGTALALANYLTNRRQELTKLRVIVIAIGIIFLPAILTAMQPDLGSTIVFFSFFIVLFREGMSPFVFISGLLMLLLFFLTLLINNFVLELCLVLTAFLVTLFTTRKLMVCLTGLAIMLVFGGLLYLLDHYILKSLGNELVLLLALFLSGLAYSYHIYTRKAIPVLFIYIFLFGSILYINSVDFAFNNLLKPHHKDRVEIMLGIKSDPHGTGYNVNQSLISIGSGGLTGKGFLQGTQTKYKFVPAQSTDFIF
jgi:rod shape determining protein RodA